MRFGSDHDQGPYDPQLVVLVAFLSAFGVFDVLRIIVDYLSALRMNRFLGEWVMTEAAQAFWPIELWMTSIYCARWAIRRGKPGLAILVASLPLFGQLLTRGAIRLAEEPTLLFSPAKLLI